MTATRSEEAVQVLGGDVPLTDPAGEDFLFCWQINSSMSYYSDRHYVSRAAAVAGAGESGHDLAVRKRTGCYETECRRAREALRAERDRRLRLTAEREADADALGTAWRLVDAAQAEIGKADAKAGFVVTLELFALTVTVGAGQAGVDGPLQWVSAVVLLAGVLLAAWVVLPRPPGRRDSGAGRLHFDAVRRMPAAELAEQLRGPGQLEAVCVQAKAVSRIARTKHAGLRWAMLAGVAGLLLGLIAAIT